MDLSQSWKRYFDEELSWTTYSNENKFVVSKINEFIIWQRKNIIIPHQQVNQHIMVVITFHLALQTTWIKRPSFIIRLSIVAFNSFKTNLHFIRPKHPWNRASAPKIQKLYVLYMGQSGPTLVLGRPPLRGWLGHCHFLPPSLTNPGREDGDGNWNCAWQIHLQRLVPLGQKTRLRPNAPLEQKLSILRALA